MCPLALTCRHEPDPHRISGGTCDDIALPSVPCSGAASAGVIPPQFPRFCAFTASCAADRPRMNCLPVSRGFAMKLNIDFASQDFFRDPLSDLKRLQAAGPVVEVRFPIIGRVWMATTQETASRVLKDGRVFTLRNDSGTVVGLRWWMPRIFRVFANNMLNMDEPGHARL